MKAGRTLDPRITANTLKESARRWIEEMGEGLPSGRFRFCETRSLAPVDGKRGQGITCFAVKSAWHIGAWQDWPRDVKEGCVQFIKSFQAPDGNFVDDWLLRRIGWTSRIRNARQGRFKEMLSDARDAKDKAVRAETRQSSATLILLGERPTYPLPITWQSESAVRAFVQSLDWSRPWDAGSHTSHVVSFLAMNDASPNGSPSYHRMLDAAFSFYPTRAQRSYYGALISFGGRQSDMHGTVMFTWACACCPAAARIGHRNHERGCNARFGCQ